MMEEKNLLGKYKIWIALGLVLIVGISLGFAFSGGKETSPQTGLASSGYVGIGADIPCPCGNCNELAKDCSCPEAKRVLSNR